jgi:HK97 gp10 family phage protein
MAVEIRGINELTMHFDKLATGGNVREAVGQACGLVEETAKLYCKEDTTELSGSIKSKVEERGNLVIGTIYTPKFYAPYVEYGTGLFAENGGRKDVPWRYQDAEGEWYTTYGQKPQPFMRPALNDNREEIKRIIQGGLTDD